MKLRSAKNYFKSKEKNISNHSITPTKRKMGFCLHLASDYPRPHLASDYPRPFGNFSNRSFKMEWLLMFFSFDLK
jgi:hypothetical protein